MTNESLYPIKVLIVDDNAQMRQLLRLTLNFAKYDLYEAKDANEAIKSVITYSPDVILLDVMMPGTLTGLDVCEFIKTSSMKDIKVIVLSAKGQERDIEAGKLAGADAYLTKPFSPLMLMQTVDNLMGIDSSEEEQ